MKRTAVKPITDTEKADYLQEVAEAVQKKFGSAAMTLLPDSSEFADVRKYISAGNWALNKVISGIGQEGAPCGRLTEIFGSESTGKTLLITHMITECQKAGGVAVLDDTEHAYLKGFGEIVGVKNDELLYSASETVEEVFEKMLVTIPMLMKKYKDVPILYAWDSLALTQSKGEQEDSMDSAGYHTEKAVAIGRGSRKVVSLIGKSNVALVIANQTRKRIGIAFGDSETTPGGDAVPFWASVRLKLSRKEVIREDEDKKSSPIIGIRCRAVAKKNKITKPFQECVFDVLFDEGIRYSSGCVDTLLKENLVTMSSVGWYELPDGTKIQGKKAVEKYFDENLKELEAL